MALSSSTTMILGPLLMVLVIVSAKQLYINSNGGSDSNSGLSPQTPLATLSRAVTLADSGDSINMVPGIYTGSLNFPTINKSVNISALSPTLVAWFQCPSGVTGLSITSGTTVLLTNVQFSDCATAIEATNARITLTDAAFTKNIRGLVTMQSNVNCIGCLFAGHSQVGAYFTNSVVVMGAAYFRSNALGLAGFSSIITARSSAFSHNSQVDNAYGAAIHLNQSRGNFIECKIASNYGYMAPGVVASSSVLVFNKTDVLNNHGTTGGGIYLEASDMLFEYGNLSNNLAVMGGCVYASQVSQVVITYSNILNNVATKAGSPFYCTSSSTIKTLSNNISGNSTPINTPC